MRGSGRLEAGFIQVCTGFHKGAGGVSYGFYRSFISVVIRLLWGFYCFNATSEGTASDSMESCEFVSRQTCTGFVVRLR